MYRFVSRYHRQLHFQSDLPEVMKSLENCPVCKQISSTISRKVGLQKAFQTLPKSVKSNLAFQRISSTMSFPEWVKSACKSELRFWGHRLEGIWTFPPKVGAGQHAWKKHRKQIAHRYAPIWALKSHLSSTTLKSLKNGLVRKQISTAIGSKSDKVDTHANVE